MMKRLFLCFLVMSVFMAYGCAAKYEVSMQQGNNNIYLDSDVTFTWSWIINSVESGYVPMLLIINDNSEPIELVWNQSTITYFNGLNYGVFNYDTTPLSIATLPQQNQIFMPQSKTAFIIGSTNTIMAASNGQLFLHPILPNHPMLVKNYNIGDKVTYNMTFIINGKKTTYPFTFTIDNIIK